MFASQPPRMFTSQLRMFAASVGLFLIFLRGLMCRPQAVVHIGPHKTSSSRTQNILFKLKDELVAVNYYQPPYHDSKGPAQFAFAVQLDKETTVPEVEFISNFLATALHHNRSIILSSEEFDTLQSSQIARLKGMLQGFDVVIVFVYRDILSQLSSHHFEYNRFNHEFVKFSSAFSVYLLKMMDDLPKHLRTLDILSNYSAVFGADNMRIIDLHGVTAAKKDVAQVILCQIAGVLCGRTFAYTDVDVFTNPSYSLIPEQVFSHLKAYVTKQNGGKCRFCASLFNETTKFRKRYAQITTSRSPPASISTKLTLLLPYAHHIDAQVRHKYRHHILEGNREANVKRMAQVQVQELDEDAFLEDVFWDNFIHAEYQNALTAGRLCNCTAV